MNVVERKNRQVIETDAKLMQTMSMLVVFWVEVVLTIVYLINRILTPLLGNQSPFSKLFHKPSDYHII